MIECYMSLLTNATCVNYILLSIDSDCKFITLFINNQILFVSPYKYCLRELYTSFYWFSV